MYVLQAFIRRIACSITVRKLFLDFIHNSICIHGKFKVFFVVPRSRFLLVLVSNANLKNESNAANEAAHSQCRIEYKLLIMLTADFNSDFLSRASFSCLFTFRSPSLPFQIPTNLVPGWLFRTGRKCQKLQWKWNFSTNSKLWRRFFIWSKCRFCACRPK